MITIDPHSGTPAQTSTPEAANDFQARVDEWMQVCFGPEISADRTERNHRFIEEALELVQSLGASRSECHQLVDYVFGREVGDPIQEVGGVIVTLAALCLASGISMVGAGETELSRIWTRIEEIRTKQAGKPKHSPLPEPAATRPSEVRDAKLKCPGVGRDKDCVSALGFYFSRRVTDDEMRFLHEVMQRSVAMFPLD